MISDIQKLRLTVSVPQNYVPAVTLNTKVAITVPEYPGKVYHGVVEASARAVDPASGTTRMQVVVDNSAGELMPGAFANTRIQLPANAQALSIPAGALIFGQKGLRVAVLDGADKVQLKSVTISRDLGQVVEIGTGLSRDDRVIDSPPDGLSDGDPVRVVSCRQTGQEITLRNRWLFGASEFADNPEPRCPCLLLLDTSGSMEGPPSRSSTTA